MAEAIGDSPNQLTIEQLASRSGMSVRNIRSHQARGLLAPPEVRLRVGYYGPDHLAQLQLIKDFQDDGFNLAGIKRLLDDTQGTTERLTQFKESLTAPHEERAETITRAELGRRFRVSAREAPTVLARAEQLGLLVPVGDDRYEMPSPSLLRAAEAAVAQGITLEAALGVFEEVDRKCDAIARAFVNVFMAEVWRPFQRADMPAEGWPEIEAAIEQLRPITTDALFAIFQRRMKSQIEAAFGEA